MVKRKIVAETDLRACVESKNCGWIGWTISKLLYTFAASDCPGKQKYTVGNRHTWKWSCQLTNQFHRFELNDTNNNNNNHRTHLMKVFLFVKYNSLIWIMAGNYRHHYQDRLYKLNARRDCARARINRPTREIFDFLWWFVDLNELNAGLFILPDESNVSQEINFSVCKENWDFLWTKKNGCKLRFVYCRRHFCNE